MVGLLLSRLSLMSPPSDGIKHEEPLTKLYIGGQEVGSGTLYIAESMLAWINDASGEGLSLLYPRIVVHGISRNVARYGAECLIINVEPSPDEMGMTSEDAVNAYAEGNVTMTEMRFVPDDKGQLNAVFRALIRCQSLHAGQHDLDLDTPSEDDEYMDADGEAAHSENLGIGASNAGGSHHLEDEPMQASGLFEDSDDD